MNEYKRGYARAAKKAVKHHTKGDYYVWLAGLAMALDKEKATDFELEDFHRELESYSPNEIYVELEDEEDDL